MSDLLQPLSEFDVPNLNFDSAQLNDPIAEQTEWSPTITGGSKSRTQDLKKISSDRMQFRPSSATVASIVIIASIGIGMVGTPAYRMIHNRVFYFSMPMVFGLIFGVAGVYGLYRYFVPIVFDRRINAFWKDWKSPLKVIQTTELKAFAPLTDIHALQIIRESCEQRDSSSSGSRRSERFYSYELNLVLNNTSRINVTDHGDLPRLQEDAKRLSDFLGKPLWDATL